MTHQQLLDHANAEAVRGELERIGNVVNVWRRRGECDAHFGHRICVALMESICEHEALLDAVLSPSRFLTHQPKE